MTLTQAQACAAAASNAGFNVDMILTANVWAVRVTSRNLDIDVAAAASLATSQSVAGKIAFIEYT